MKIFVRARTGAKREEVKKISDDHYMVAVKAPPVEGRANDAIISLLSEYFDIPRSRIRIVKGLKSRDKVIEIG